VNAIAIRDLVKSYGKQRAVDDLTLEVDEGSVYGLLGPNGSGKSTTFKCLLGLARPDAGELAVCGSPVTPATFEYLSFVPERATLCDWMNGADHLEAARRAYAHYDEARAAELVAIFKLDLKKRVRKLSKGQQTALALVLAFSIRPRVLVLDEPSSGLDPIYQRVVLDLIIDAAAGGGTVVFSSHQIGQVERAADRVGILSNGKLVLQGDLDTLKGNRKVVEAVFPGEAVALGDLARDPRIEHITQNGRIVRAYLYRDPEAIVAAFNGLGARSVTVFDLTLEDMFLDSVEKRGK